MKKKNIYTYLGFIYIRIYKFGGCFNGINEKKTVREIELKDSDNARSQAKQIFLSCVLVCVCMCV